MLSENITQLVGGTPVLHISNFSQQNGGSAELYAKLECFNPAGSAKDRVALYMIKDAEKRGVLKQGGVIVEPTSGNTGIGLAAIGARLGYRVILTMPDTMSVERIKLIKAYGAEVVLTKGSEGMKGAIARAEELCKEHNGFMPCQFENKANALAHYEMTGPELWADMNGKIDVFVASVGTGGTLTGVARYLKEQNPAIQIVAVEPADSPLLSEGRAGAHKIQGIGANFVPEVLEKSLIDKIITATTEEAFSCGRAIARSEGILVGISSGAVLSAALKLSKSGGYSGRNIAMVLTDTGERYLSSEMFAEQIAPRCNLLCCGFLPQSERLRFPSAVGATAVFLRKPVNRLAAKLLGAICYAAVSFRSRSDCGFLTKTSQPLSGKAVLDVSA